MENKNLSEEIRFVGNQKPANENPRSFEELASLEHLSFDPLKTGTIMQVEGLLSKSIATKSDLKKLKECTIPISVEEPVLVEEGDFKDDENESITDAPQSNGDSQIIFQEKIGDTFDILPIWFLEAGYQRSKAICLINTSGVDYKGRKGSWSGTGFLISSNILITNHHVLNSTKVCENAVCLFNFQMNEDGKVQATKAYQINPARLFITSPHTQLDFTFCWVEGEPGKDFNFINLFRHAFVVKEKDCANIIQHPDGKLKAITVQQNEVTYQDTTVVRYKADTLSGSSGALVASNEWKPFAIHHATRLTKPADILNNKPAEYINEGIKFSAIATYLETISKPGDNSIASEVLRLFQDTDTLLGYFGSLGRQDKGGKILDDGLERVVDSYMGEDRDVDIAFWNIEWFNKNFTHKLEEVAKIITRMNLDVWAFEETSPEATEALVKYLKSNYQLDYNFSASEPNAPSSKQTTTIIWNTNTVHIERKQWPEKIERWFSLRSEGIETPDDLDLESGLLFESVDGKIFDRYPGLFYLETKNRGAENRFSSYIVPLHLKAMGEGSKRRQLASRILAIAVQTMIEEFEADDDWILGGDLNATLASEDFNSLTSEGFQAISAKDEANKEMTYIKGKFKSLIDHIFLSPNFTDHDREFFIVAQDNVLPHYLSISDHRPILMRLSLKNSYDAGLPPSENFDLTKDSELAFAFKRLRNKRDKVKRIEQRRELLSRDEVFGSLRANQNRKYYDEDVDKVLIKEYYGKLPRNFSPENMYNHFNNLITKTHTTHLSYKPAKYLYPWVDLQEDKETIVNIYNGDVTTPEALIEADLMVERKILEEFQKEFPTTVFEGTFKEDESLLFEKLENDFSFNCEHVVPQSWFAKQNPMKGDLHHLFSCVPNCNSFRGNIPYYEFPDWEEKVMEECGMRESGQFEPKNGKGPVARATLYFLLRYQFMITQYSQSDIITLLTWHTNEPPTVYEKHRNAAIQELQGNRNPLIDFPSLAGKIDFNFGLK